MSIQSDSDAICASVASVFARIVCSSFDCSVRSADAAFAAWNIATDNAPTATAAAAALVLSADPILDEFLAIPVMVPDTLSMPW